MPRFYPPFLIFILLFLSAELKANRVIVKGQIKSSSTGLPIANKKVKISVATYTGTTQCYVAHEKITNSTGVYADTLECSNADITKVQVSVEDCNGQMLTKIETVPSSKIVELNFPVCNTITNPPTNCEVAFSFEQISGPFSIRLNSSSSHGVSSSDNIIKRRWKFGDGKILEGNEVSPAHVYEHAGKYEVCLTIKTSAGCESKQCKSVVIEAATQATAQCAAKFSYENLSTKKIRFNSGNSVANSNSTVIERKWDFGDGTQLGGNEINPAKEYARPGIYTVCLQIRTSDKCENRICTTIHIEDGSTPQTASGDYIKIISLHPNPTTSPLTANVWSLNNINAELSIYDIYGVKKWSTTKVLSHGTNITVIPTNQLSTGPYFFKVSSMYGVQSKPFYKL